MSELTSILIPSRNEKYLNKTVDDIYKKATGDFEVIIGLNGKTDYPFELLGNREVSNIKFIQTPEAIDLKVMINRLVKKAYCPEVNSFKIEQI